MKDELLVAWWSSAGRGESDEPFLAAALSSLVAHLEAECAVVVRGTAGNWEKIATAGRNRALPADLLSDSLDRAAPCADGKWLAAPLDPKAAGGELLAVCGSKQLSAQDPAAFGSLALLLGQIRDVVDQRDRHRRRVRRLEEILTIAAQWNQTFELDQLLEKMAAAATRLLEADRASIFLWDRPLKTLVGRPALGVPGGELRVPDDQGVVGRVLQTGEVARVDADDASAAINRRVDQQLGFKTRNLVCVPLRGRGGELFGVFEVLNKRRGNFSSDDVSALVELSGHAAIALENSRQFSQLLQARNQLAEQAAGEVELIGACPAIEKLRATLKRVAATDLAVLIMGENGTGKEVVSRMIHYGGARRREPLVAVNCAALPETLLESELFGHEKGAFTDAREARAGKFELAAKGTLLLDEIGDMSLGGQAKLLRVLEDKVIVRVGGSTPIRTDTRVIAATNQKLGELVRARKFREDLFFRLNVATVELPPLRERGEDAALLAEHFLKIFSRQARREPPRLTDSARRRLLDHSWPGNVRELKNLVERLVFLCPEDQIDGEQLSAQISPLSAASADQIPLSLPLAEATDRFQTEYIKKQIAAARDNMTLAAERLGLHRSNLYRKMRQLEMDVDHE